MSEDLGKPGLMDIFVHRPILAIVISATLILVGLSAATELAILQFPEIESSTLVIKTPYVGASAEIVQGFVSDPIERAASSVPGVDYVDSFTQAGMSTVNVYLKINENSTDALAELASRLDQIRFELPRGAEDPAVSVVRADRSSAAFYLDVHADGMSRPEITDFLMRQVNPILSTIGGIQRVTVAGGRLPAMRIWLDPARMAAFNVSSRDIENALNANNIITTLGRSENSSQRIDLMADTALTNAEEFKQLVIRESQGSLIRISDVARVELGEEEGNMDGRLDQDKTVFIAIYPLPGANEIAIADALYLKLAQISKTLPKNIRIGIGHDVTIYMRDALREIFITLMETILLVGLVVFAFMGSVRTALVPLVAIPVSLLGAIACMTIMGFSLNLLTILAIVLSVGLVVDDAIVVVENVARYMREGMTRRQAALASSRQLLTPIIGMTITLAAVYAPIGFLSGLTGVLFKEFAFTLAVAVLISGLVALTLSPIMSAYACPAGGEEGPMTLTVNRWFTALQTRYEKMLAVTLDCGPQVITVAVFLSALAVPFYLFSQQELAPNEDQSSINVIIQSSPEASIEYTTRYMREVADIMTGLSEGSFMWQMVTPNGGFSGLELVNFKERDHTVHDLLPVAFGKLSEVTGIKALPVLFPALPTAGQFDVEMVVLSTDSPQDMKPYADQLVAAAFQSGKFMFADTDLKIDLPQARFKLNRERIADLGMDLSQVSSQLGVLLSGNYVNRFNFDGKAYRVIPMIEDYGRPDPVSLMNLKIRTPRGDLVPVSAIAELEELVAPRVLGKFQQNNSFRIYGGILPGTTKEQALSAIETAAEQLLPPQYSIDYAGESRQLRQEGNTLFGVLGIALAFVFLVLTVQFNSFRDPLVVILGSVPLALSGAMLFAYLGWTTINIYSQVGFITLIGLIAKNGILIVEFANQQQRRGVAKLEAIKLASSTRLRPVLMTTGATVLGHFPLVLVTGAGAEARNSIGIILVAGMLVGTLFTLFILPSVYIALASDQSRQAA